MPLWPSSSKHRTCAPDMLFTQTIKSQNMAKPHSSGEETLWHNRRTCPDSGLRCGIGSHCLTDSCRNNEEEEEEEEEEERRRRRRRRRYRYRYRLQLFRYRYRLQLFRHRYRLQLFRYRYRLQLLHRYRYRLKLMVTYLANASKVLWGT